MLPLKSELSPLEDGLPSGLDYVPGTLTATSGTADDALAPLLQWTGSLSTSPAVTVTYAVTVTTPLTIPIVNTATLSVSGYEPLMTTATIIANGYAVYVPLVLKEGQ